MRWAEPSRALNNIQPNNGDVTRNQRSSGRRSLAFITARLHESNNKPEKRGGRNRPRLAFKDASSSKMSSGVSLVRHKNAALLIIDVFNVQIQDVQNVLQVKI